jgi:MFS family permease
MNFAVGWRQVAAIFYFLTLVVGIVFSTYGIVAAPIGRDLHASHSMQMAGIGAIMMVGAVLSPTVGGWIDRYPFRNLAAISAVLVAGGLLALSFAQAMWQVVAIYAVFMAVPSIVCGPMGAAALLMRWFVARRGRAMGIAIAGLSAGSFIFPVLTQHLIASFDWRIATRVLAAFVALTMLPVALFVVVERPSDLGLFPDGGAEPAPDQPKPEAKVVKAPLREVLFDPNFWLVAMALGLPLSAGTGATSNIVLVAADIGIDASYAALVMSAIAVSSALGKLTFAAIADRYDSRLVLFGGMILFAVGMFVLATAGSLVAFAVGSVLIAYGSGFLNPLWGILFPHVFDSAVVGRVMGLALSIGMALAVIAPILIGKLRDVTGAYEFPFMLYGALILLMAVMVRWIRFRSA